jgi:hypothetical protein
MQIIFLILVSQQRPQTPRPAVLPWLDRSWPSDPSDQLSWINYGAVIKLDQWQRARELRRKREQRMMSTGWLYNSSTTRIPRYDEINRRYWESVNEPIHHIEQYGDPAEYT